MESPEDQDARQEKAESEIELAASPERVWEALTTSGGLSEWMGDGSLIDPEVGGEISVPDVVTGVPKEGRVDWIEDARRLDFTWWIGRRESDSTDEPATRVSIQLTPTETGTQVRVIERPATVAVAGIEARASAVWAPASAAWAWRCSLLTVALLRTLV